MNKYKEQLDKVDINNNAVVRVCSDGTETEWMQLNHECIKELRKFLDGKILYHPRQVIFVRDYAHEDWVPVRFAKLHGDKIIGMDSNSWNYAKALDEGDI